MSTDNNITVRSRHLQGAEVAWFAPLCNGDDAFLSQHDFRYKSDWNNTSNVLLTADRLGYRNILCPSSYQVGQDTLTFAAAVAPLTQQINLLTAIRCGEVYPPMLARTIATLDHILKGRLTINIISSNMPGEELDSASRYQRSREVIEILKQCWTQDHIDFKGEFYQIQLSTTEPVKPYQQNGGPLLYFGGYSPPGVELCAEHCDVYLMWPEREEKIQELMTNMSTKAASFNRTVDFGLRVHVIVRETESEARAAAKDLMSFVDDERGEEIRLRAQDGKSYGVSRQTAQRALADADGFVEDHLWTGIGRARSGCGAAIVGNPDQVLAKLQRYVDMGIRAFILSGYPHLDECKLFAKYVLPRIPTISLPVAQGRIPAFDPNTPLAAGIRR
ncbi:MAG: LLM class flavin-dependent oxidoreductase [Bacteroidota bacterium]